MLITNSELQRVCEGTIDTISIYISIIFWRNLGILRKIPFLLSIKNNLSIIYSVIIRGLSTEITCLDTTTNGIFPLSRPQCRYEK